MPVTLGDITNHIVDEANTIFIYPDTSTIFDAVKEGDILRHNVTGECYEIIHHRGVSIEARKIAKSATLSEFKIVRD